MPRSARTVPAAARTSSCTPASRSCISSRYVPSDIANYFHPLSFRKLDPSSSVFTPQINLRSAHDSRPVLDNFRSGNSCNSMKVPFAAKIVKPCFCISCALSVDNPSPRALQSFALRQRSHGNDRDQRRNARFLTGRFSFTLSKKFTASLSSTAPKILN